MFHTRCLFFISYCIISSLVTFWNVGSVDENRNLSRKHLLGRWAMICDFHQTGWRAKTEQSTVLSQRFLKSLRRLIDQFRNLTYIRKVQLEFRIFQNDVLDCFFTAEFVEIFQTEVTVNIESKILPPLCNNL